MRNVTAGSAWPIRVAATVPQLPAATRNGEPASPGPGHWVDVCVYLARSAVCRLPLAGQPLSSGSARRLGRCGLVILSMGKSSSDVEPVWQGDHGSVDF